MKKAKFKELITIAVSEEQRRRIREITDCGNLSVSEWIRTAIENRLAKKNSKKGENQQ